MVSLTFWWEGEMCEIMKYFSHEPPEAVMVLRVRRRKKLVDSKAIISLCYGSDMVYISIKLKIFSWNFGPNEDNRSL